MNLVGGLSYLSWPLYFIWRSSEYSSGAIVEAMITLHVAFVVYFLLVHLYHR
ncbi:hypothetical protein [Halobacillus salinus]|uniref:hypothetical protein n=1 Tax=Halobacillus salinus TaxID=192814 RepID=UPI001591FBD4|nr:hypothetical protein [Halobacillus salinus]